MTRPASRNSSLYFDYPHYPFVRPPELDGETIRHPVIIVGAGPVGVTAALELARHGIRSVVLDDKDSVNDGSRAICIARHSFEILQQLGLSDRFVNKALGWTHGTSYYRMQPVFRLEMPHSEDERFYPMYNIQQQFIEQFLIDKAMEEALIELRWQSRLEHIELHEDCAILTIDTPEGDYKTESEYVIAADGARSAVRKSLGLKLRGDAYEGKYVIVDIQMQSDYPTERRAFFDPPANPGSTVLVHKQPDNIWRVDYQLQDGEDEETALQEDNIRKRVGAIVDMIGEPGPWELEWWSLYKAYTLALDDYRHERVFFTGDAAHLVPIFGVRGLNSGFADAANIGWKLAYALKGNAPDALLDSYSPERRGATMEIFDNATKSTRFMTPPTRGYALMREAALSLSISQQFSRPLINPRQSQPYTYVDSPLTAFPERNAEFDSGPGAGSPLVNRRIGEDDYLLDHLGHGFSGLYFNKSGALPDDLDDLFSKLDTDSEPFTPIIISTVQLNRDDLTVLQDREERIFDFYGADDGTFYLVRPDRHITARWRGIQPDEVLQAFKQALGEQSS
ncbi:MAG: FAD-dependent monooxygenase [Gammaproteobacteria bacterium]